ncbi:MAG TPA: polyhydroxyalkanoate synthesis regulator DNA-binding domain-containing protein [Thermoanaerobaculia bacterium]|nr:polyhydroxyalkanoate synthesis regulator DNA-binding domain-containing protein [Thermoanaerobaculia bacterium]
MASNPRRIVRYRNRKLYEAAERRFVTIHDLAASVAAGNQVEVIDADSGKDITARILSRALASGKGPIASTDTLARLLRAGSDAAETVAEVVEKVGGKTVAASVRRAVQPERLAETLSPIARRLDEVRRDMEHLVGGLVEKGRMNWDEESLTREIADLKLRLAQLEAIASEARGRRAPGPTAHTHRIQGKKPAGYIRRRTA